MRRPTRRALLRAGAPALAAALAGCQSRNRPANDGFRDGTTTRDGTTDGDGTTTGDSLDVGASATVNGATVTVTDVVARESIVYPLLDTLDVAGRGGEQFAIATVETDGGSVDPADVALRVGSASVGGARYLGTMSPSGFHPRIEGIGRAYDGDTGRGWIGFPLSSPTEGGRGHVRLARGGDEATWRLPADVAGELAAPAPSFDLREVAVESGPGSEFTVRVRVRNDGDRGETFRGCVNVCCAVTEAFAVDVPAGETRAWTWTHQWRGPEGATVDVKTVAGEVSRSL